MKQTMHASAWLSSGGQPWGTGRVIRYEVMGLPPGEEISIADFGGPNFPRWESLRIKNRVSSGWVGNYDSPDAALEAVAQELC